MNARLEATVCATAALVLTVAASWTLSEGVYTARQAQGTVTIQLALENFEAAGPALRLAQAG
ncbi:MAG TPA: hypothetical protein VIL32_15745 [Steroidobacteraceae bacterium]